MRPPTRALSVVLLLALALAAPHALAAPITVNTPAKTFGLGTLRCAAYTSDGLKILAAGGLGPISMIDTQTSNVVRTFTGHTGTVYDLAVSPTGRRLLSGGGDGTARLWNVATGDLVQTWRGGDGVVLSVAMSSDAGKIIAGSQRGIRLWLSPTQSILLRSQTANASYCPVAFSHDGTKVAGSLGESSVRLWDAATGALLHTFTEHQAVVRSLAFSPDDTKLLSGGEDRNIIEWSIASKALTNFFSALSAINTVDYSPDGKVVLGVAAGNSISLWDAAKGDLIHSIDRFGVSVARFSGDGSKLLVPLNSFYKIEQIDALDYHTIGKVFNYTSGLNAVAFSPDGKSVLIGGHDKAARLWDVGSGNLTGGFETDYENISCLAFRPDGQRFITTGANYVYYSILWGVNGYKKTFWTNPINAIVFSNDGSRIAAGDQNFGGVRCFDSQTLLQTKSYMTTQPSRAVHFMHGNKKILFGDNKGLVRILTYDTWTLDRTFTGHLAPIIGVDVFPDEQRVLSADSDGVIRIWNVTDGTPFRKFTTGRPINAAMASPDGQYILTGGDDLRLLSAETGEAVAIYTHKKPVRSVDFSPDGTMALSGGDEGLAYLWNLPVNAARDWKAYR